MTLVDASLDEIRQRYGSIEGYFTDGLQLDAGVRYTLLGVFVESSTM